MGTFELGPNSSDPHLRDIVPLWQSEVPQVDHMIPIHPTSSRVDLPAVAELLGSEAFTPMPSWVESSICPEVSPSIFFLDEGGSQKEASKICRQCEVGLDCISDSLRTPEIFGFWGGLGGRDRRKLHKMLGMLPDPTDLSD